MIRSKEVYLLTYNANAAKYLKAWTRYTTNIELGTFKYENTWLPFLFDYAEYNLNINNTKPKTSNNVLDKIITEI